MSAVMPLLALPAVLVTKFASSAQTAANAAYARAGTIADQCFSKIRTVAASTAEERSITAYTSQLKEPQVADLRAGSFAGSFTGIANALFFWTFALAMWYGSLRIRQSSSEIPCPDNETESCGVVNDGSWTGGKVITVMFATVIGSLGLGLAAPLFQYL